MWPQPLLCAGWQLALGLPASRGRTTRLALLDAASSRGNASGPCARRTRQEPCALRAGDGDSDEEVPSQAPSAAAERASPAAAAAASPASAPDSLRDAPAEDFSDMPELPLLVLLAAQRVQGQSLAQAYGSCVACLKGLSEKALAEQRLCRAAALEA